MPVTSKHETMETTVIDLFGGPGIGKSVMAAYLYAVMSWRGLSVELIREYIKTWAWREHAIGEWDEPYILGKQLRYESMVYGKVKWAVADRPLAMSNVYSILTGDASIKLMVDTLLKRQASRNVKHVNFMLKRVHKYQKQGRFHSEEEALMIDDLCRKVIPDLIEVSSAEEILEHLGIKMGNPPISEKRQDAIEDVQDPQQTTNDLKTGIDHLLKCQDDYLHQLRLVDNRSADWFRNQLITAVFILERLVQGHIKDAELHHQSMKFLKVLKDSGVKLPNTYLAEEEAG